MAKSAPIALTPLSRAPSLLWRVPGSKSITNRALILAALSEGETLLEGVLESDDTRHMRTALAALGVRIEGTGTTFRVFGGRSRLRAAKEPLFVGNSGTTVRFLSALCALVDGETTLYGDAAMSRRPIAVLVEGLRSLGVEVECPTGCPPLKIKGGRLPGGRVEMQGELSSQYFSALLMAAACAEADVEVRVAGTLVSRPYVDITRRMMEDFGGAVEASESAFLVRAVGGYRARPYQVEPDASAASYPFALAAASGGRIEVPGLGTRALQGDYAFVDILERAGARVERFADRTIVEGPAELSGVDVDMRDVSDTVMTLAAIAPVCRGKTTIRNVANIRLKETDRLAATAAELERLGQRVETGPDWLTIDPQPVQPASVHTYDDHRMAMSFAVLGAVRAGVTIEDPACVAKTYPGFFEDLGLAYRAVGDPIPWALPGSQKRDDS